MSKTVVIHQPDFLPHLAFFHRFLKADLYVALDHTQFVNGTSRSWTHRDRIKTPRGATWITVSVQKAPRDTPINAIELSKTDWRSQNLNLLRENYRTSAHYDEIFCQVETLYSLQCATLCEFNMASIHMLMRLLDIPRATTMSSSLHAVGHKNELLVDILTKVGATRYISGVGAKDYFDPLPFSNAAIAVEWQRFNHPTYPQLHGEFVPFLSSIDMLFNCGADESRAILRNMT